MARFGKFVLSKFEVMKRRNGIEVESDVEKGFEWLRGGLLD